MKHLTIKRSCLLVAQTEWSMSTGGVLARRVFNSKAPLILKDRYVCIIGAIQLYSVSMAPHLYHWHMLLYI